MAYYCISVTTEPDLREILLAFLEELPFASFAETDEGWDCFANGEVELLRDLSASLENLQRQFPFQFKSAELPAENWNVRWESNFSPIRVGSFCGVRASFHPPLEGVRHELVINPKMAFGTGHHETTFMMIEMMQAVDWTGRTVLDFGAGTAILAILAAKLGAAQVDAVEIEEPAVENARENVELNQTAAVEVILGDAGAIPARSYELVLANINRNVILDSLGSLYERLLPGSRLYLSGFYRQDVPVLLAAASRLGLTIGRTLEKNRWCCLELVLSEEQP